MQDMEVDAGQERRGGLQCMIDFMTSAHSDWAALFPAHSETADVMKSMMHFDPPQHPDQHPSPYLAMSIPDISSHPNWLKVRSGIAGLIPVSQI